MATDSGGLSRIAAFVIVLPLATHVLTAPVRPMQVAILAALTLPGTFFIHPSAFAVLALCFALRSIQMARAHRSGQLLLLLGGGAVAALPVLATIVVTEPVARSNDIDLSQYSHLEPSLRAALRRLAELARAGLDDPLRGGTTAPKELLCLAGAIVLARSRRQPPARMALAYIVAHGAFATLCMMLVFIPSNIARALGLVYYNEALRIGETFFITKVILVSAGLVGLFRLYQRFAHLGRWTVLGALAAVLLLVADVGKTAYRLTHYIEERGVIYRTPRKDSMQGLIELIREKTPTNAVLLSAPFVGDRLESDTGRRNLFIYHECPSKNPGPNCVARLQLFESVQSALERASGDCFGAAQVLTGPIFALVETSVVAKRSCSDATLVGKADGYALLRINRH
jgi:hypothetical protein